MKKIAILSFLLASQFALAASFTPTEFQTVGDIKIPKMALLDGISLHKVGTGIRQKKVIFVPINVYQATLFVSDLATFVRNITSSTALASLANMPAFALSLHFLRDVSSADVVKSFETALLRNGVNESAALTNFKNALTGAGTFAKGQIITIAVNTTTGMFSCLHNTKTIIHEKVDAKLFIDIFSIWLGTPADNELAALKTQLIMGQ